MFHQFWPFSLVPGLPSALIILFSPWSSISFYHSLCPLSSISSDNSFYPLVFHQFWSFSLSPCLPSILIILFIPFVFHQFWSFSLSPLSSISSDHSLCPLSSISSDLFLSPCLASVLIILFMPLSSISSDHSHYHLVFHQSLISDVFPEWIFPSILSFVLQYVSATVVLLFYLWLQFTAADTLI